MSAQDNAQLVRELYEAFNKGDLAPASKSGWTISPPLTKQPFHKHPVGAHGVIL